MSQGARSARPFVLALVRGLGRLMLRSHYRRIEVSSADRVPAAGPVLLVANHQNSLVDTLALLHACPRPASPLAKAPLWKSRLLRPFLNLVGAIPVFRPVDREENEGVSSRANAGMFEACRERLAAGGVVEIFPEGVSQPQPRLMPLRTGAARIALDAPVPVTVVPVGLVYTPPARARRGALLVRFGEPFVVDGREAGERRRAAVAATTRRIEAALRGLLPEAASQGDLAAMRLLRTAFDQETGAPPPATLIEDVERTRRFAEGYRALLARAPADLEGIRAAADAYARSLALAGVPPEALDVPYSGGRVARFLLQAGVPLLLGAPLWLAAAVLTWPARAAAEIVALRVSRGSEDVWAFGRMAGNAVSFLLAMGIAAAAAAVLAGPAAAPAGFAAPPLLLAFLLWARDRLGESWGRVRGFLLLAGGAIRGDLRRQRRALYDQLSAAARRLGPPLPGPA